jgi:hypothetical protein
MSATPQGVEAQQAMVDITTNNYQKAIEAFFSHYCSYALTIFFAELKGVKGVVPTADARIKLVGAGFPTEEIKSDGTIEMDFETMAVEYWVRCVPGSLVELEDEKQLRILNQMFIPLSQAMPAMAATQDKQMLMQAAKAMQYIIGKQIELSGSASAKDIGLLWKSGDVEEVDARDQRMAEIEESINNFGTDSSLELELNSEAINQLQEQMRMMAENQQILLEKLGVVEPGSTGGSPTPQGTPPEEVEPQRETPSVYPASA